MSKSSNSVLRFPRLAVSLLVLLVCALPAVGQQKQASPASSDPLLQAMREELDRSKAQLKMENVPAPYYIEYHVSDLDEYDAEAAFGVLRDDQRVHARYLRVIVRVGDYKQDSYYGPGIGAANFATVDDDPTALRWQLWITTDQAYKAASEALAMKKAALRQYTSDQPFDDFAHAPAIQSIEPLAKLDFDPKPWREMLEKSTALFRTDPKVQFLSASVRFRAVNQYLVNTEGTVSRSGYAVYFVNANGSTQAADGMSLSRAPYFTAASVKELPAPDEFVAHCAKMIQTLKDLREAPVVDEDYRGPVLFAPDAASDIFNGMIGRNVLGIRPRPGDSARTTGEFASNYKSRVLPSFLSVEDDPTLKTFEGKTLIGSYDTDDEGVRAVKVPLIEDGQLVNYLVGRQPIRDFPESNGHGRASPGQFASPNIGNLIVQSKQGLSPAELKQKLIEICRQDGKAFGYYVETLGGPGYEPRLLYRVYEKDGHQELVRGAVFDELDARALRNDLVAAGNDPLVGNREGTIPTTVISPSILFDDLEVKRTDAKNAKLPEYPSPDLSPSR
ncbi:MAG: peptidase U62 [Acidobacteriia bacterium]|nr:peptidase U62 [Terriglobia bacterium]